MTFFVFLKVDKTVEKIKHACQTTSKKLQACMQNKEADDRSRSKVSVVGILYD